VEKLWIKKPKKPENPAFCERLENKEKMSIFSKKPLDNRGKV